VTVNYRHIHRKLILKKISTSPHCGREYLPSPIVDWRYKKWLFVSLPPIITILIPSPSVMR